MKVYRAATLIERGKSVHVFSSVRTHAEAAHTHDFIEIVYIMSGSTVEVIDKKEYRVRHGDMIFINYGSTHASFAEGEASYINICFSPETMGDAIITADNAFSLLSLTAFNEMRASECGGKISFSGSERREVEGILTAMLTEYKSKQASWDSVIESYLNILITKMLRKNEAGVVRESLDDMWQELSEYIDKNLNAELTLSALARKCFYNPSYFSRSFKEKFGVTLVEYVSRKRLDHAVLLLCETDLSVDEISSRAGFSDRRCLYHAFAKYIGSTPAEYRAAHTKVKKHRKTDEAST